MRLIAIARMRAGPEAALFARYVARIRPRLTLTELVEARGAPAEIRRREAEAMLSHVPRDAFAVAMDKDGAAHGSEGFARLLEAWLSAGRAPVFLIGGAEGLDERVIARADQVMSLGPFTWPHMLARVMLAEQIYRARAIAAGHPYHRA